MWPYYTAPDRRDALLTIGLLAVMVLALLGGLAPFLAAWAWTGGTVSVQDLWAFWTSLSPRGAFRAAGHQPGWFWTLLGVFSAAAAAVMWWAAPRLWWAFAPTGTGFATHTDVAGEMSAGRVRQVGRIVRPDLSKKQLANVDLTEVGLPIARTMWHEQLWLAYENALGVFAPTQSGKTLMVLIHQVLAAPGFAIVTSTKPDLLLLTGTQRQKKGPVLVFDLTGAAVWPHRVKWNPTEGCVSLQAASRRAEAMMAANSGNKSGDNGGGNHQFFVRQATDVLTCLLLAAAIGERPLSSFVEWCLSDKAQEPVQILAGYPEFVAQWRTLTSAQQLVPETYVGVWQTLRDGVASLADQAIVTSCTPEPGEQAFDVARLIAEKGTVYVIGSETDAARLAPLITAFVQHVLDTGRRLALTAPAERLAPPALAILDELPSICPLPDLPTTLADTAGRGFIIVWAAQSYAQLETRWGTKGATAMIDNTTAVMVMGGIKSSSTLKWASTMCGFRHDERISTNSRGRLDATSVGVSLERLPILDESDVREIRRKQALLVMRHLPPLIVKLNPAWKRKDWKQLTSDRDQTRALRPSTPLLSATALEESPV